MRTHMLVESSTKGVRVKCGKSWAPTKLPTTEGYTGWWRRVNCPDCLDAMNLSDEHRALLES